MTTTPTPLQLTLALTLSLISFHSTSQAASLAIPNFQKIDDDAYRGGTPGNSGVQYLKSIGVKTIVNLDNNSAEQKREQKAAAAAGIRWINIPMSGFWKPRDADVNAALDDLSDPSLRPIYVHCKHGQDRTGVVVALYRVEQEHWQPGHAYAEMKDLGFHPSLFLLNHYFEKRTGFED